ncbi:hypothetical protein LJ707_02675 [Mucilaginibacter sp. UR6-1]|nr:hypothetical protein [Mucilaginibacter sp. UR6-1]
MNAGYFDSPPVFITRVFSNGVKKTGYIYYDEFKGMYDRSTLDSLAKFKQQGITDLVIDLRYNPGGDVPSVAKMGAAIAGVGRDQVFLISQANKNGGKITDTFGQSISKSNYPPVSFNDITALQLNIAKLYVLTGSGTASSAELLINNLKPYLDVIQIGEQTLGKDMAGFAINDQRQPKQVNLIMHPLIFKLYNASNQGDYPRGLVPDYLVNELSSLPLKPFGDSADPLISKALELSLGSGAITSARRKGDLSVRPGIAKAIYSSSDERSKNNRPMVLERPQHKF